MIHVPREIPCITANLLVRSIIAILPTALRRGQGSTAPKIVRWCLFSILSESVQWSWETERGNLASNFCISRECCFFALLILDEEEKEEGRRARREF
ncbi:hypothetical protein F5Y09DRAFT_300363 [Xylaria sp. FL1042]|nr:hypothetical protein F5Y09DRAFT_300363 [Xylaria sp. FL1042]